MGCRDATRASSWLADRPSATTLSWRQSRPRTQNLIIVIDHLARCTPALQADWAVPLLELAGHDRVHVKLSAIDALSDQPFPFSDMWRLVKQLARRVWRGPVAVGQRLAALRRIWPYGTPMVAIKMALDAASDEEVDAIMALTASRLFGFGTRTGAT